MQKHISFKAELGRVLALLGPYIFLLAIGVGAAMSHGSWSVFFDHSFKQAFGYGVLAWLALGLWCAGHYKVTGRDTSSTAAQGDSGGLSFHDDADYMPTVNTNGIPMGQNGFDIHGNVFGTSSEH